MLGFQIVEETRIFNFSDKIETPVLILKCYIVSDIYFNVSKYKPWNTILEYRIGVLEC